MLLRSLRMIPVFLVIYLFVPLFQLFHHTTALFIDAKAHSNTTKGVGPQITIVCTVNFQSGETHVSHKWIFGEKVLSENTQLSNAVPSRFSLSNDGYTLYLRNALKSDGGHYICQITYMQDGAHGSGMFMVNATANVIVDKYLPPLRYPECALHPASPFTDGNSTLFTCLVMETTATISTRLTVDKSDGSTHLSDTAGFTHTLSLEDHGAVFKCTMMSSTFPTAAPRMCSVGPIIVRSTQPRTTTMATMTVTTPVATKTLFAHSETALTRYVSNRTDAPASPSSAEGNVADAGFQTWIIIAVVTGAFLIITALIIVCVILRCRRSKARSEPTVPAPDYGEMIDMRRDQPMENIYSSTNVSSIEPGDSSSDDDFPIKAAHRNSHMSNVYGAGPSNLQA